jgi:hypothetical protein
VILLNEKFLGTVCELISQKHTRGKWNADSASMEHAPQIGLGESPILWILLFKQNCSVINKTNILCLFLDKISKYLVTNQ